MNETPPGVLRFTRIGFPYPDFTAHFVGTFEIACGLLFLLSAGGGRWSLEAWLARDRDRHRG